MPNPKRRHSKARRDRRRAHDHLTARSFAECSIEHSANKTPSNDRERDGGHSMLRNIDVLDLHSYELRSSSRTFKQRVQI